MPGIADALLRLALPPTHTGGGSSPAMEAELALTKPFRLDALSALSAVVDGNQAANQVLLEHPLKVRQRSRIYTIRRFM